MQIKDWIEHLGFFENPVKNSHFSVCPGASDDPDIDIPDSCVCTSIAAIGRKFNVMRREYYLSLCSQSDRKGTL